MPISSRKFTHLLLLIRPQLRRPHREITHALDDADALGHRNRAAGVEQVEQVRALQHLIVSRQHREALLIGIVVVLREQFFALGFVFAEEAPQAVDIRHLEVVNRKLQLVGEAHVGVFHALGPLDVVNAFDALQERDQPLQTVSDFGRHQIQIDAAALLEVGELRDLLAVQHHLPADAPGAERGRFPVVLFELNIVLRKIEPMASRLPRY